jgi:hypothetical protein
MIRQHEPRCAGCDARDRDLERCLHADRSLYLCSSCCRRLGAVREEPSLEVVEET